MAHHVGSEARMLERWRKRRDEARAHRIALQLAIEHEVARRAYGRFVDMLFHFRESDRTFVARSTHVTDTTMKILTDKAFVESTAAEYWAVLIGLENEVAEVMDVAGALPDIRVPRLRKPDLVATPFAESEPPSAAAYGYFERVFKLTNRFGKVLEYREVPR